MVRPKSWRNVFVRITPHNEHGVRQELRVTVTLTDAEPRLANVSRYIGNVLERQ